MGVWEYEQIVGIGTGCGSMYECIGVLTSVLEYARVYGSMNVCSHHRNQFVESSKSKYRVAIQLKYPTFGHLPKGLHPYIDLPVLPSSLLLCLQQRGDGTSLSVQWMDEK